MNTISLMEKIVEEIKEVTRITELTETMEQGAEALESLSKYNELLEKDNGTNCISTESYQFIELGLNTIKSNLGYIDTQQKDISLESLEGQYVLKEVVLESIGDIASKVWDKILEIFRAIKAHFIKFFNWIREKLFGTKKKVEEQLKTTVSPDAPVFTEKGENFDKGTVTVTLTDTGESHHEHKETVVYKDETKEVDKTEKVIKHIDRTITLYGRSDYKTLAGIFVHSYKTNKITKADISEVIKLLNEDIALYNQYGEDMMQSLNIETRMGPEVDIFIYDIAKRFANKIPSSFKSEKDKVWELYTNKINTTIGVVIEKRNVLNKSLPVEFNFTEAKLNDKESYEELTFDLCHSGDLHKIQKDIILLIESVGGLSRFQKDLESIEKELNQQKSVIFHNRNHKQFELIKKLISIVSRLSNRVMSNVVKLNRLTDELAMYTDMCIKIGGIKQPIKVEA